MRTATRGRSGRTTTEATDGSRRQLRNGYLTSAETTPAQPPSAVDLRPLSRTGRLGPLQLRQLVLVEMALAVVAVGLILGGPWLVIASVTACALVLLAVARRRGHAVQDWTLTVLALRSRTRSAASDALRPGLDPTLAPIAEGVPGLVACTYVDRNRRTVGMLGDGSFLTAVIRVEAGGEALRPASGIRALPLAALADALTVDDICLESAQLVQQVRTAPAPHLPEQAVARLSYAPLQQRTGAPALRMTWMALKLDPELCREAVEARGGGLEGAQRCLVRAADHAASRLSGAGFRAVVLDQEELNSSVATSACANPALAARAARPEAPSRRRTTETARFWRCDDRWHTTYAVGHWPELGRAATPLPQLMSSLTSFPAYAATFSVTVRRGSHRGAVNLSGHVRVTGGSDSDLAGIRRALESAARSAKVDLVRLDREQLQGALATLPLGGTR